MERRIPAVLWIGLAALALFSVLQFAIAIVQGRLLMLVSVALNVALLYGLYRGHRWAFVVTLAFGILGIVVTLIRSPALAIGVLIGNGLILVPVVLAREYFWGPRPRPLTFSPNYCARCGHDLRAVADSRCPNCGAEIRAVNSRLTP